LAGPSWPTGSGQAANNTDGISIGNGSLLDE